MSRGPWRRGCGRRRVRAAASSAGGRGRAPRARTGRHRPRRRRPATARSAHSPILASPGALTRPASASERSVMERAPHENAATVLVDPRGAARPRGAPDDPGPAAVAGGHRADLRRRPAHGVPDPPPDARPPAAATWDDAAEWVPVWIAFGESWYVGAEPLPWAAHQTLYRTLERYDGHVHYRRGLGGIPRLDVPRELVELTTSVYGRNIARTGSSTCRVPRTYSLGRSAAGAGRRGNHAPARASSGHGADAAARRGCSRRAWPRRPSCRGDLHGARLALNAIAAVVRPGGARHRDRPRRRADHTRCSACAVQFVRRRRRARPARSTGRREPDVPTSAGRWSTRTGYRSTSRSAATATATASFYVLTKAAALDTADVHLRPARRHHQAGTSIAVVPSRDHPRGRLTGPLPGGVQPRQRAARRGAVDVHRQRRARRQQRRRQRPRHAQLRRSRPAPDRSARPTPATTATTGEHDDRDTQGPDPRGAGARRRSRRPRRAGTASRSRSGSSASRRAPSSSTSAPADVTLKKSGKDQRSTRDRARARRRHRHLTVRGIDIDRVRPDDHRRGPQLHRHRQALRRQGQVPPQALTGRPLPGDGEGQGRQPAVRRGVLD